MFGRMTAMPILELGRDADLQTAITILSRAAGQAEVARWIEFPESVLLFLLAPGNPLWRQATPWTARPGNIFANHWVVFWVLLIPSSANSAG